MQRKKSRGVPKKQTASGALKAGKPTSKEKDFPTLDTKDSFPIVGIGASAGGLEAFEQFFTHTPPDTGMTFVLIQHLDPKHKSILTELVQRYTVMTVHQVEDGMAVKPNTVYVIPPNRNMALLHGNLHLLEPSEMLRVRNPIDFFFRSLAEDRKEKAICIVLSGTGTEGSMGLRAVKGEGGMVMVQDPESAKYDGMPRSAVATGLVDYILPPEKMPEQLIGYVHHALDDVSEKTTDAAKKKDLLQKIFVLVRSKTGHDFSYYKQNTILRRIERRMAVNQITRLSDYVRYMQDDHREAVILFKELLIGVTNFFRDKEAFEALRDKAIPQLFENRSSDNPVRIWVPGCATGEEAYSIAMLCQDFIRTTGKNQGAQVFATDIDGDSIETARLGLYPNSMSVDVPPDYLDRFFNREDGSLRINKEIRDRVVFALQNVISDPPFSKIDLISCRNLLIYLGSELQKKVLPLFHYSLNKEGFLFLGSSETIGEFSDYFSVVDRKWKLYKRKDTGLTQRQVLKFHAPTATDRRVDAQTALHVAPVRGTNYRDVAEKVILESYGLTGVLINEKSEVFYIHGRAGKYLEPPSGEYTGNITALAREGLKLELTTSIRKALTQKTEVRAENVRVKTNGDHQLINLVVKPISEPASLEGLLMVIFEDLPDEGATEKADAQVGPDDESHPRVRQLEQELRSNKEYLQATIEELETSNEELKSTNEELESSNEELQSTNEELETSKEELQSINEELTTVNSELQQKMEELSKTGSDLNNLLASTEIGTIFLDTSLNIRRFTPAATEFFSLLQTDIGRPVSHLASRMHYDRLSEDAKAVLKTLVPKEMEVETKLGRWFKMRILPYRTIENVIDGVVITFVDITQRKEMEIKLRKAHDGLERQVGERSDELRKSAIWFRGMFRILDEAVLVVTPTGILESVNPAAERMFGYEKKELTGKSTEILHVDHEHYMEFGERLKEAFEEGEAADFDFSARRKNGEVFPTHHTVSLLTDRDGETVGIVSVVRDISEITKS